MSNTQFAFLKKSHVPERAALQSAIDKLGFDLTLPSDFTPFMDKCFMSCTLNGDPAPGIGFEIFYDPIEDIVDEDDETFKALVGDNDYCISMSWHSNMRDCACVMIVSCALSKSFDAIVSYEGNDPDHLEDLLRSTRDIVATAAESDLLEEGEYGARDADLSLSFKMEFPNVEATLYGPDGDEIDISYLAMPRYRELRAKQMQLFFSMDGADDALMALRMAELEALDEELHLLRSVPAAAHKLLADYEKLKVESTHWEPVKISAYGKEIIDWYEAVSRELATLGFEIMGDLRIAGLPSGASLPNFARKLLSSDGRVRGDIFQSRSDDGLHWQNVVNIATEFTNGTFLDTNNSPFFWNLADCQISEHLPQATSATDVALRHRERMDEYLHNQPKLEPVALKSLEEIVDSENRAQFQTAAFRRRQGVPSTDELIRLGASNDFAALLHEEMQRIIEVGT